MDTRAFNLALTDLAADRVHGASELARRCLCILSQSARNAPAADTSALVELLANRCEQLKAARPTMAPVRNLLAEWQTGINLLARLPLPTLRATAGESADRLITRSNQAVRNAIDHAITYIGPGKRIITHSLSSTVLNIYQGLQGAGISALITESRPLNEGYILARRLSELGIPTELITESQLGLAVAQADVALVGADSLLSDGSLLNKAGTYLLALAARDKGVPFHVCCESYKYIRDKGYEPELEEMEAAELRAPVLPGVKVRNVYFDTTPPYLISRWIDENGVHDSATGLGR